MGCAYKRSQLIKDYGDRNIGEQTFKAPLVLEGVEEGAVLDLVDNFDPDASGDVIATKCQNHEREIARFRSVDRTPQVQNLDTGRAGTVHRVTCDFRRRITVVLERSVSGVGSEEFVEGLEAAAGENQLPAHLRGTLAHKAQQLDLLVGVRSEIRVAALGRNDMI